VRLGQASEAEQTAAFYIVYWDLVALVKELPGIAQGPAMEKLNSVDGRARVIKVIDDALAAAEQVRNTTAAPKSKR
jgi:hypothetical protein